MTTQPGPEHRPETILSEYGEGYCRHCYFVVGLNYDGLLYEHVRGYGGKVCKGSLTRPPKVTPYASKKAMFRSVAHRVKCPVCGRDIPVLADGRFQTHSSAAHLVTPCKASYTFPPTPERDHNSERG